MQRFFHLNIAAHGVDTVKLMVLDGQGGGIGATLIKGLRASLGLDLEILALGTNSIATSRMMKAGANRGGSGENAIVHTCQRVDIIVGPISILMANAMMGELTPKMASAVGSSTAQKILLPLSQEKIRIIGVSREPLPHLVSQAVNRVGTIIQEMDPHV
ncbi:MAG: hypothetical protein B6240_06685 [Desulfobacteraceae bacterium 4572_87]|nr:MAG: hypothetical protein B6240_06685 [Desulfobacteraceae bacterium 4572_87]